MKEARNITVKRDEISDQGPARIERTQGMEISKERRGQE